MKNIRTSQHNLNPYVDKDMETTPPVNRKQRMEREEHIHSFLQERVKIGFRRRI